MACKKNKKENNRGLPGSHIHCDCGCCAHDDRQETNAGFHQHDSCHSEHHHCHSELDSESPVKKILLAFVIFAAALLVEHLPIFSASSLLMSSFAKNFPAVGDFPRLIYGILYLAAYLICGRDVIKGAVRNIHKGNVFGEQFLMTVASVGAIFVGEFAEAVAVMLFYNLGEFVQDYAVDRS
ncbi:MAG: hypothetical protein IJ727_07315, partial [Treponema sp.]|nr:hypothetical protein [Treponema sp.]